MRFIIFLNIKVRVEQGEALIKAGGGVENGGMDVVVLELPYIFGSISVVGTYSIYESVVSGKNLDQVFFCYGRRPAPWNFDELSKHIPFFAQLWYDTHDESENNFFPADCYMDIIEKENELKKKKSK